MRRVWRRRRWQVILDVYVLMSTNMFSSLQEMHSISWKRSIVSHMIPLFA